MVLIIVLTAFLIPSSVLVLRDNNNGNIFEWDGHSWQHINPTDSEGDGNPTEFWDEPALAFDTHRMKTVLFQNGHLWEWDGAAWVKIYAYDSENSSTPPPLKKHPWFMIPFGAFLWFLEAL